MTLRAWRSYALLNLRDTHLGAVLTIQGKQYDVEKDFTWAELMLVEELGPAFRSAGMMRSNRMTVIAAFVFSIQKRDDDALTWEAFVKQPIDVKDETDGGGEATPYQGEGRLEHPRRRWKPWMPVRPWEMDRLTPDEEAQINALTGTTRLRRKRTPASPKPSERGGDEWLHAR
jgi:hypothetical protein